MSSKRFCFGIVLRFAVHCRKRQKHFYDIYNVINFLKLAVAFLLPAFPLLIMSSLNVIYLVLLNLRRGGNEKRQRAAFYNRNLHHLSLSNNVIINIMAGLENGVAWLVAHRPAGLAHSWPGSSWLLAQTGSGSLAPRLRLSSSALPPEREEKRKEGRRGQAGRGKAGRKRNGTAGQFGRQAAGIHPFSTPFPTPKQWKDGVLVGLTPHPDLQKPHPMPPQFVGLEW